MSLAQLIPIAMSISLFIVVLVLGMKTRFEDLSFLLRHPGLLIRSILAMNVIMLIFVVALSQLFDLNPTIKIALVALAVSPVPPLLPGKQIKAGGAANYAVGLLAAASVVAIVLVPVSIELMEYVFPFELHISAGTVTSIIVLSVLLPLVAGIAIGGFAPAFAQRCVPYLSAAGTVLLLAALIPSLVKAWPAFAGLFSQGVLLCLVLFSLVGIAVGHLMGGPVPTDRTVLALATATRHPGIAMAIASLNFPDQGAVLALIIYHLVVASVVSLPYLRWRTREHGAVGPG
ncbi:MAG: Na+-dependent transporter [Mesorhizobium sp.]|uniref:bile acid:sodium symporter family protein n=1 Tax=Mesorhizobium sp. TaxID=1871066 RepID=UPI000FEA2062|nr:Na+-dependent transporter [Mesorhizobium sp.]RWP41092.1 MAG: Na+-dependent transporter [Mesorhizobium sp.]